MVILRTVPHLRLMLQSAPPDGGPSGGAVSAVAMAVILTVVLVGAITLAVALRRTAMGGGDSSRSIRPYTDRARTRGEPPADAWTEAGRRMQVPPREEDRT